MRQRYQAGLTIVELVVSVTIIATLTLLIMNFLVDKYVENTRANAKADLQLQMQLTLDLINRDVKYSANVDDINRWEDNYAPGSPADNFSWVSDADTLVLAQPVQNSAGEIIYDDPQTYVSYKDNLIYYIGGDNRLYRRTVAAPVGGNAAQTTCPPPGSGGCPTDSRLTENVTIFNLTYYDANDNQVAPDEARSVRLNLKVSKTVFGRDLQIEQSIRTVFRNE